MKNLEIGILYLGLHNQLFKKYGANHIITRKEFFCKIGKHGQIPKSIRHLVMKEMEDKKLIERVDRDNIKILSCDIDLERDANKLYQIAGIFYYF